MTDSRKTKARLIEELNDLRVRISQLEGAESKGQRAELASHEALSKSGQWEAEALGMLDAARAILKYRKFEDAARSIFDSCKRLIGAPAGYVALLTKDGLQNEVLFLDSGGLPCSVDPSLPMPIRGLRAEAYRTARTVYENDFSGSDWMGFMPHGHVVLTNVMFAPLVLDGKAVGLIGLGNKPGGFTDDDARTAAAFGELAAVALQNSRTLESLEKSEERLRSVLETATAAIITADGRGNAVFWNRGAEITFGYFAEEIIGKPLATILPECFLSVEGETGPWLSSTGETALLGRTVETIGVREDGVRVTVDLSLAEWGTEEELFVTAVCRNITKRVQAEKALRESERKYRQLVESLLEGIWLIDKDAYTSFVNPRMAEMLGYTVDEMLGRHLFSFMDSDSVEIAKRNIERRRQGIAEQHDFEFIRKDGTRLYGSLATSPVTDEEGNYAGAIAAVADITERRRMEEALRISQQFLEIANRHVAPGSLLEEFVAAIKRFTGCEAVGVRLLDDEGYIRYHAYDGFSREFYDLESPLSITMDQCMCINVIKGDTPPDVPFYTSGGSFYMNGTTRFLATVAEEVKRRTRNKCNEYGYESVALVPIRFGDGILGLIHIADTRENMVPLETVEMLEGVALQLGTAIQRVWAEAEVESIARFPSENPNPVLRIAHGGTILYANPASVSLLSDAGTAIGQRAPVFLVELVAKVAASGLAETVDIELRGRIFSFWTVPVRDGGYVNLYGRDITDRRIAERELEKHRQFLEEMVQERTSELRRVNEQLRREVVERKRAEEAVIEQSRLLEAVWNHTLTPLVILDRNFNFIRVNEAYAKACGRDVSEFPGHNYFEFYPSDAKAIFEQVVGTTVPFETAARPFVFADHPEWGVTYWDWTLVPLLDSAGDVELLVFSLKDVTERQRAKEELERSHQQLRELAAHVQSAREEERRMVAREVHDELGQALTALKMDLSWLQSKLSKATDVVPRSVVLDKMASMSGLVDGTIQSVQRISAALRPSVLDDFGLLAAIEWQTEEFEKRTGIKCSLNLAAGDLRLDESRSTAVFRILQETLTNVARHAQATRVSISLKKEDGNLILRVRDNGRGITETEISSAGSLGILGIRERAHILGGTVLIAGVPGKGTTVTAAIPLSA